MSSTSSSRMDLPLTATNTAAAPIAQSQRRPAWAVVVLFLAACVGLIWMNLGSHPLHGRSEGRYAVIAQNMASGTGWAVPIYGGDPHLEKPPLTAWCEATCIRLFGPTEWAIRAPNAIAGSLVVVLLFLFAWRVAGWRVAMLATGVMAVMPLHLAVTRLTLPDGPLALYWWATLATAYLCIVEPDLRRWRILLWVSVAAGFMTKGPAALLPLLSIIIWLALAKPATGAGRTRIGEVRRLWLIPGFLAALLPLIGWVITVFVAHPDAGRTWFQEIVGRFGEHAAHREPIWFFIPVFIWGLFPASAMLALPFIHYPINSLWPRLRSGSLRSFLALAVLVPFVIFSVQRGKLTTYILPLAPPMALLTGLMLDDWLSRREESLSKGERLPEVRWALFGVWALAATVVTFMLWAPHSVAFHLAATLNRFNRNQSGNVTFGLTYLREHFQWTALPLLVLAGACGWMVFIWRRRPALRLAALAAVWAAMVAAWASAWIIEDQLMNPSGRPAMLTAIHAATGLEHPRFVSIGFLDTNLAYYTHSDIPSEDNPDTIVASLDVNDPNLVIVAEPAVWKVAQSKHPELVTDFAKVLDWPTIPLIHKSWILRPTRALGTRTSQPASN